MPAPLGTVVAFDTLVVVIRVHRWAVALVVAIVGAIYSFTVALGLPYGESAHWSNVRFLLNQLSTPGES